LPSLHWRDDPLASVARCEPSTLLVRLAVATGEQCRGDGDGCGQYSERDEVAFNVPKNASKLVPQANATRVFNERRCPTAHSSYRDDRVALGNVQGSTIPTDPSACCRRAAPGDRAQLWSCSFELGSREVARGHQVTRRGLAARDEHASSRALSDVASPSNARLITGAGVS
jgi:hypothetical protein